MNRNEFATIMATMNAAFPSEKITKDAKRVKVWWSKLRDLDYRTASRNLSRYIDTETYPPSIADIRGKKPGGFNNFSGRSYNMDKLELVLLGLRPAAGIEELMDKNEGGNSNGGN